jgi:hypothetical protein
MLKTQNNIQVVPKVTTGLVLIHLFFCCHAGRSAGSQSVISQEKFMFHEVYKAFHALTLLLFDKY